MSFDEVLKAISNVGLPAVLMVVIVFGLVRVGKFFVIQILKPAIETVVRRIVAFADKIENAIERVEKRLEENATRDEKRDRILSEMQDSQSKIADRLCHDEGGGHGKREWRGGGT